MSSFKRQIVQLAFTRDKYSCHAMTAQRLTKESREVACSVKSIAVM
jgi:hypothetical protein